jgi:hypothetical protein
MEELLDPPPKAGADPEDPGKDGAEEVEAPKGVARLDDAACPPDVAPPKAPGVGVVAPNAGAKAPNEVLDEVGAAPKGVLDGVDPNGVALEDGVGAPKIPDVADPNAGVVLEGVVDAAPKGALEGVGAAPKGEGAAEVAEAPVVAPNRAVEAGAAPKDGVDAVWGAPKEGVDEDPGAVGVAAVKPLPKDVGVDEGAPKAAGVEAGAENPDEASALVAAGAEKAVAEEDDEGGANDIKPVDGAAGGCAVVGAAGVGAAKKAVAAAGADGRAEGAGVVAGIVKAAVGGGWTCGATDAGGGTVATGTAGVESESERAGEGSGFGGGGRTPDNCSQRKKGDEHCYKTLLVVDVRRRRRRRGTTTRNVPKFALEACSAWLVAPPPRVDVSLRASFRPTAKWLRTAARPSLLRLRRRRKREASFVRLALRTPARAWSPWPSPYRAV